MPVGVCGAEPEHGYLTHPRLAGVPGLRMEG
jgi:hypothetical protein